jgi:glutamyl-tRNA reductase
VSELLLLGTSHKTAPVSLRERLALTEPDAPAFLGELTAAPAIREAAAISTCNRTEVYLVVSDPVQAESAALGVLASRAGIRPTELADAIYSPRNCDVARHLFRVASGLESMIVGEAEVQGQVRRAHDTALAAGTTGPLLNRLFAAALTTGKRVRTETAIGEGAASIPSVAVDLAEDVVWDLREARVLVIGAGETSELTAQALAAKGVRTVFVANRHADRARSLAERFGGAVVPLETLPDQLAEADVVVSSTASPHAIVHGEELSQVMAQRADRPLLVLDLAVPRDVEPSVAELPGVRLVDVDGLERVVSQNLASRAGEARRAEVVVEQEIEHFARWLGTLDVLPTVRALREHGDDIVGVVLGENAGRWESASPRDLARVEAIAKAVANRLLHEPTIRLKSAGGHGRLQLARELFGLEDASPAELDERRGERDNVRPLKRQRGA